MQRQKLAAVGALPLLRASTRRKKHKMNGIINWVKANRVKAALIAASSVLLPWGAIEIAGSRAINAQIAPYPPAQRHVAGMLGLTQLKVETAITPFSI